MNIWKWKLIRWYDLPLERTLNVHNVLIRIKLVFNENYNHYYYQVFLEKYSYNILMFCYDQIDVFQGIDVNKTCLSNECIICHCRIYIKDLDFNKLSVTGVMMY